MLLKYNLYCLMLFCKSIYRIPIDGLAIILIISKTSESFHYYILTIAVIFIIKNKILINLNGSYRIILNK